MCAKSAADCIMDFDIRNIVQRFTLDQNLEKLIPKIYLHQGRTDQNGGHYDWLNRMGWGFGHYHYHHKLPAHLHPDGKCPYEDIKASSIINPYTGKKINIGIPYIFEGNNYFSLNLVSRSLTAHDGLGTELGLGGMFLSGLGGLFYACSNGYSFINDGLGEHISFTYPKNFLGVLQLNTFFNTDNGEMKLLCYNEKSEPDDVQCYLTSA